MNNFKVALGKKLYQSQFNNFGGDNYDVFRFGENSNVNKSSYIPPHGIIISIKQAIKKITGYKYTEATLAITVADDIQLIGFEKIYDNLNEHSKALLVDLIAYRQLDYKKVKLPRNNSEYWKAIDLAKMLSDKKDTYDPKFMHFVLEKFDLNKIGFDIKLYFTDVAIAIDFILEQYSHKQNNKTIIGVESGDVVLDVGACWGDTALYFASKAGQNGKVYSFEFIPGNLNLFNINLDLNPNLKNNIKIIEHPVSDNSNKTIYYKDFGPGSEVVTQPFEGQTGSTTTITIDDFVKQNNVEKVDFIKMDIEGAEPYALKGAIETIKKYKPKLAIAIYHSMDDMVNIPNWILDLNLGYEIFIDHFTIHTEETICFAKVKNT